MFSRTEKMKYITGTVYFISKSLNERNLSIKIEFKYLPGVTTY